MESSSQGGTIGGDTELTGVVYRNIRALLEVRKSFEARKTAKDRVADAIAGFAGSMAFVLVQAVVVLVWVVWNIGWAPYLHPFDPYPFVLLAMSASVEAIFLTTFVLISQNRLSQLTDQRADLDLQISLLAEHEITHVIELLDAVARHLGVEPARREKSEDLKKEVKPEALVREIERAEKEELR